MVGLMKNKTNKLLPVYFGHPSTFWRERQRLITESKVNTEEMKKLSDVVDYDSIHLQKAIINRTCMKVQNILNYENDLLESRRERLRVLIDSDNERYVQELVTKQEMEECGVCKEREKKNKEHEEHLERERVLECQKTLEREKIAKGMQCKKKYEIRLKEMQKIQMAEKRSIGLKEEEIERMWHHVLVEDVRRKEEKERLDFQRRQDEMLQTRKIYDEQINSANKKRTEALNREREKENRRIERIKKRMEEEYIEGIKRKKEQQMMNKNFYLEGHNRRMCIFEEEKRNEQELDDETEKLALEGIREERRRQRLERHKLQMEKKVFQDNYNLERRIANELEREAEKVNEEWRKKEQDATEEQLRSLEIEKRRQKEKLREDYKKYLEERRLASELERKEREITMERVRQMAVIELQHQLSDANEEFRKQMEYRNSLNFQLENNQRAMCKGKDLWEKEQNPFSVKAQMFKDGMDNKVDKSPGRLSTNPVHPFARVLKKSTNRENKISFFPQLTRNM